MLNLPDKPSLSNVVKPILRQIELLTSLSLKNNEYTINYPNFTQPFPSAEVGFLYASYGTTIQDLLDGKITGYINYDIPKDVRTLEWINTREVSSSKFSSESDKAWEAEAASGFNQPRGIFKKGYGRLRLDYLKSVTREIAAVADKESKLSISVLEFAANAVNTREEILFDSHNHLQASTLQFAILLADTTLREQDAYLKAFSAQISGVNVQIDLWKKKVASRLQQIEGYNTRLKAIEIKAESDSSLFKIYEVASDYIILKSELEVLNFRLLFIQFNLEKAKISKYIAELELFIAKVNVNTAEFEVYKARIDVVLAELDKWRYTVNVALAELKVKEAHLNAEINISEASLVEVRNDLQLQRDKVGLTARTLANLLLEANTKSTMYRKDLTAYLENLSDWLTTDQQAFITADSTNRRTAKTSSNTIGISGDKTSTTLTTDFDVGLIDSASSNLANSIRNSADNAAAAKIGAKLIHEISGGN